VIRHPSRHYIYYLISKRSLGAIDIILTLKELGLPVPPAKVMVPKLGFVDNPEYEEFTDTLSATQSRLRFPPRYDPKAPGDKLTVGFLDGLRIRSMWEQDPFVCAAADILNEPAMKRMIEVMLLGPLNYDSIARRMSRRYNMPIHVMNPRVVQAYAHYYWDFQAVDREDWDVLLHDWMPGRNIDYSVSLSAPRTKYGAALSAWMADGGITPLKDVYSIRAMRDESFRHFMQASTIYQPGWKTSQAMRDYFQVFLQAQEAIEMRQGGTAEVLEELRRIEAEYDRSPMTTVHELPSGSMSVIDAVGEVVDTEEEPVT
jgi:hypothetical protein